MHTCECLIRPGEEFKRPRTAKDILCGAPAPYKHGLVWLCGPHYKKFYKLPEFWIDENGVEKLVHTCSDLSKTAGYEE